MLDIGKLLPKLSLPDFTFLYWDRFLGIFFVLAALLQGGSLTNPLLPSGFGLIGFSMARRCWHYIGAVRLGEFSPQYKRSLAYPKFFAGMVWLAVSWICFHYAALDFHITAPWVRRILQY